VLNTNISLPIIVFFHLSQRIPRDTCTTPVYARIHGDCHVYANGEDASAEIHEQPRVYASLSCPLFRLYTGISMYTRIHEGYMRSIHAGFPCILQNFTTCLNSLLLYYSINKPRIVELINENKIGLNDFFISQLFFIKLMRVLFSGYKTACLV